MPTTYTEQFYLIDPYAPPAAGTTLSVYKYEMVDADDDGDIGGSGDDTINGVDVTSVYQSDFLQVTLSDGSSVVIEGATFYLADGSIVFTPNDGTVLEEATFESSKYTLSEQDMLVGDLGPPCFTSGTMIQTPYGPVSVEKLKPGMAVTGVGGKELVLKSVLSAKFSKRDMDKIHQLSPVRIVAGALGNGLPNRDLLVSRQHRVLLNTPIVNRIFGVPEVLIPAIKLTSLPGIFVDTNATSVAYFHLVFDTHEIVYSEGAASESLFTGPEALRSVSDEARKELFLIFPELAEQTNPMAPYCAMPHGQKQKNLVSRLASDPDRQSILQQI